VLRTAAAVAPTGVETVWFDGLQRLPLFNPDDDLEGASPHPEVAAMRAAVQATDGILICTPEYAGALPAALKNLLEWTIGDAGTYGKPVAWINASGPAAPTGGADAHASLAKVLAYAGADVVAEACLRLPVTRDQVGTDGLLAELGQRGELAGAVGRLADRRTQT
jgi:NAD(P)H-dependent FMN reductase